MRLESLEVAGFRGFAAEQKFDLDADAVIVVGVNGNGKTSLFDAVLWAISGRIPRLGSEEALVSKFSGAGQARVVLRLRPSDGAPPVTVTRSFDGNETRVHVDTPHGVLRGPQAEGHLIQLIWKEAATASRPSEALATVLTQSVYLQQDLVRQFIDSVTDQERFVAVSELLGAGRVTDLQGDLERAKAGWSKATNSRIAELQPLRNRLADMESRLSELMTRSIPDHGGVDDEAWQTWWAELKTANITVGQVPLDSRDAPAAIDAAIRQLDAARRSTERRQQLLDSLRQDLDAAADGIEPDIKPVQAKVASLERQIQETRSKVAVEQARVAEERRRQADLTDTSQQLQALATLALKHLGEKCPVCDQAYDIDATRQRLEAVATSGALASAASSAPDLLPDLLATLASQEKGLSVAQLELGAAEQSARIYEAAESTIEKRFAELDLEPSTGTDWARCVEEERVAAMGEVNALVTAQQSGEEFALRLSQTTDQALIQELRREIETTMAKLKEEDEELARRTATGEEAQRVIESLRGAASDVVSEQVKDIEPLLSEIYSRIDVHPAFRAVRFLTSTVRGRGLLSTLVCDPLTNVECDSPMTVLSSSQMNALAVCVFLSLNLSMSRPPLETAILDDPLQSLDDINLLGLIDLLRCTKDQRQLLVSTHDVRFGGLLSRKLRPRSQDERTVVIGMEDWSRNGPVVVTREVKSDPTPFRLIAS